MNLCQADTFNKFCVNVKGNLKAVYRFNIKGSSTEQSNHSQKAVNSVCPLVIPELLLSSNLYETAGWVMR